MTKTFEINDEELAKISGGKIVDPITGESDASTASQYLEEYLKYILSRKDLTSCQKDRMITKANNLLIRWAKDDEDHTSEEYHTAIYNMPIA